MTKRGKIRVKAVKLLKLDFGCGQIRREGFIGVDVNAAAKPDVVADLFRFPWPWSDSGVEEVFASHFFEHVPAKVRAPFMDELYRVLTPGGKVTFIVPDGGSNRAVQDFTHEWPPIVPESFLYFNRAWRVNNKLDHYPVKRADFDFSFSFNVSPPFQGRSQEYLQTAIPTMRNVASDLIINLLKRPEAEAE